MAPLDKGIGAFAEPTRLRGQHFIVGSTRSLEAIRTRSHSESAFILRMSLPRCALTVISLMPNSPPTCLFIRPEMTRAITSRSRGLNNV